MAYGRINKQMDAAAEIGRNPVRKHQIQSEYVWRMSRLTRSGTAELVSRDKLSGGDEDMETSISPVQQTTSRFGNLTRLIHNLLNVLITHTYIYIQRIVLALRLKKLR